MNSVANINELSGEVALWNIAWVPLWTTKKHLIIGTVNYVEKMKWNSTEVIKRLLADEVVTVST